MFNSAWCYYDNDSANGEKYGKLYNWYAVNDPRGLAPAGWRIPSDEDWDRLTDFLLGVWEAGSMMKSTEFWADSNNKSGKGTNKSGFSALPGGLRHNSVFKFRFIGEYGYWWSSTESNTKDAWFRYLSYGFSDVTKDFGNKEFGMSVRCLRD